MAIIEVDDPQQLSVPYKDHTAAVREANDLAKMHREIAGGPNRLELMKLLKKQYPNLAVPEIDAAVPVNAEIAEMRKAFDEYKEQVEKEKKEAADNARKEAANTSIADGRKWLRQEMKCDDDGVAAVEKIMQDNNIANYDIAYAYFASQQPKAEPLPPSSYGGSAYNWFAPADDAPDHQLLTKDPVAFKNAEVAKFFKQKAEGRLNLGTQ